MSKEKIKDSDVAGELFDEFDRFEQFISAHWRHILYSCGAIVLIVAGVAIFYSVRASIEAKAVNKIAAARTIDEMKKVIDEYPSNPAATSARVRLAALYCSKKDYTAAEAEYKKIIQATNIPDILRWRSELNIAYILELENSLDKAAAKFADIAARSILPDAVKAEANFSAGRIYLVLKNNEKAVSFLTAASNAKNLYGEDAALWQVQAKQLLERLKAESNI